MCPKCVFIGKPLKINCPKEVKIKKSIYKVYISRIPACFSGMTSLNLSYLQFYILLITIPSTKLVILKVVTTQIWALASNALYMKNMKSPSLLKYAVNST